MNKSLQKQQSPEIQLPSKEEKKLAEETHKQLMAVISDALVKEHELESSYIRIGSLLYKMQKDKLWIPLNYESWGNYYEEIQEKYSKGKSQLYAYLSIAKTLRPLVDEKTLLDMGVTKAGDLRKAVATTGKAPSPEILKDAIDKKVSTEEFRKHLFAEQHIQDHNEKGKWHDLKGCYFTDDEWQEFEEAIELAKSIDPVVPHTLAEHVQRKEALLRLAREFKSTWG